MQYKISITERGKTINYRGAAIRTPVVIILSENERNLIVSQMRQLNIGKFLVEPYEPEKKINQKEIYIQSPKSDSVTEPIVVELENTSITTLKKLAKSEY